MREGCSDIATPLNQILQILDGKRDKQQEEKELKMKLELRYRGGPANGGDLRTWGARNRGVNRPGCNLRVNGWLRLFVVFNFVVYGILPGGECRVE